MSRMQILKLSEFEESEESGESSEPTDSNNAPAKDNEPQEVDLNELAIEYMLSGDQGDDEEEGEIVCGDQKW